MAVTGRWSDSVYFNQFDTTGDYTVLGSEWEVYTADPGNGGFGYRSADNVNVVANAGATSGSNALQLRSSNIGGRHAHAGVKLLLPRTYMQAEVRVRVDDDFDQVTSGVVLFWPTANPVRFPLDTNPDGPWPSGGEIDFWETFDNRATRTPTKSYVHRRALTATPPFTAADDETVVEISHTGVDQSDWHKIVCSWTPDAIYIEIDNGAPVTITDNPDYIPRWPMELTLQFDAWSDSPPTAPLVMDVDYVLLREWVPIRSFPDDQLDVGLEMAPGADLTASPMSWEWTDYSDRLRGRGGEPSIRLRRGRPDEGAQTNPSSVSFELDNSDGAVTPDPTSTTMPRRGTPMRLWVEGAQPALYLPGTSGSYCSTPDDAAFTVSGDLDVRAKIEPHQWSHTGFGNTQAIVAKYGSSGDASWLLQVEDSGVPQAQWSLNGSSVRGGGVFTPDARLSDVRPIWVGATFDVDDGAGNSRAQVYAWRGIGDPPADITTWEPIREAFSGATGTLHDSAGAIEIGSFFGGTGRLMTGHVYTVEIRDGINGTLLASPDFTTLQPGDTTLTDAQFRTWTIHGDAEISTRRLRAFGTIADAELAWPVGDNAPTGPQATESWVRYEAAGALRALDQGAKPLESPLYRAALYTSGIFSNSLRAYWPCESGADAGSLATAGTNDGTAYLFRGNGDPITWSGDLKPAADSSLSASDPLPTIEAGKSATWSADIGSAGWDASFLGWSCSWVYRMGTPETHPTATRLMTVTTLDDNEWRVDLSSTTLTLEVRNSGGTLLNSGTSTSVADLSGGKWVVAHLKASNTGGSGVFAELYLTPIDGGTTASISLTFSSVPSSQPVEIGGASVTGPADGGLSFGHIAIDDNYTQSDWQHAPAVAHIGETATARIKRLCDEQGVAVDIVGDLLDVEQGELGVAAPMGPQGRSTLLQLLRDCVQMDGGVMSERLSSTGLVYRTRRNLEGQTAAITLAGSADYLVPPLPFRDDDQRYRNEVTVTSRGGTSATALDADEQTAHGRYDTELTLNGVGGLATGIGDRTGLDGYVAAQNASEAQRRLYIASFPGLRCAHVGAQLHVATNALIEQWHTVALGDRVTLSGLPAQSPTSSIELLCEAISETLLPSRWTVDVTCSPGGPWVDTYAIPVAASLSAELTASATTNANAKLQASDWTVDLDPETPDTWNQNRPDGQLIVAGNRLQQGATTDDINAGTGYGLSWSSNQITSFAMESGETKRLSAETVTGLGGTSTALIARHQWQNGNGYDESQETAGGVNLSTTYPGTDRTYFDGTRTQYAMIPTSASDPKAVAASFNTGAADTFVLANVWRVESWMRGFDDNAGIEIHGPSGGTLSPYIEFIGDSQLKFVTRDQATAWTSGQPPSVTHHTEPIGASDVGNWWGVVTVGQLDPVVGTLEVWLNTGTGFTKVVDVTGGWGWAWAEGNSNNDIFYAQLGPRFYSWHRYTNDPTNAPNNWDPAYNERVLASAWSGLIINPSVTTADVLSHCNFLLDGA